MSQNTDMARHYGNMRFAMFTVFTAIVGALILIPLSKDRAALVSASPQKWLLAAAGISMSLGFLAAELRISRLVAFYQEAAFNRYFRRPRGHGLWVWLVPLVMILPYVFSILFWVLFLCGYIKLPA
jgi:hypothetical protein